MRGLIQPAFDSIMKLTAQMFVAATVAALSFSVCASDAAPAAAGMAKPDLAKGEAMYTAVCASCHGADGNSPAPTFPNLAQQHPQYLVKQLQEFKSDKRKSDIMKGFATMLQDVDMQNISHWLATKKAKEGASGDKALAQLGERIYRGGIADRQIAACSGCHSPSGAGIPAQFPRLSGQHGEYSAAQLTAFRDGVRLNSLMMGQVAAKLNDREIKALADYLAGLR